MGNVVTVYNHARRFLILEHLQCELVLARRLGIAPCVNISYWLG